ncbi:hypothetical protein C3F09_07730 [candidate division GN15 bacterium]|uniref:Bacteriocin-protection protein n=1 Tax=candidate division GN15 bacterium TaxID=2072418 RepID=A0A855X4T8_9BACT|nr:MAG: hypothetical protein C3F09_07730 [candidate division GN15 bacterium]
MTLSKPLNLKTRSDWRKWLTKNHATAREIWLVYYKKHTGKSSVAYNDAVEEAICFGWIDGQVRRLDDERYMQRYSPRTKSSTWSALNVRRAKAMIKQGLMTEVGLAVFKSGKPEDTSRRPAPITLPVEFPEDLRAALAKNKKAEAHFATLPPSAVRLALGWIVSARKPETRKRRIKEVVATSAKAGRIGMK